MGDVNRVLQSSPIPLCIGGKTYLLSPVTKKVQAAYEAWMEKRLLEQVQRLKTKLDEDSWIKISASMNEKIALGAYSFGSAATQSTVNTRIGGIYFMWLVMKDNHPGITEAEIETILEENYHEIEGVIDRLGKEQVPSTQETASQ